ncbi:WYL domain-containing protein [Acetobacterium wieringae]|uniref:helix-turn-helix transcriptional regulator n=1 Tax=Acetobacterium wieringae TaxID=52694 RepID=UPI002B2161F9|nr:WYL domain-containing protein [Acetobacterium wieringae]MEA4804648.1 WYL domain-containing protein [Acetobacterium wieringae]
MDKNDLKQVRKPKKKERTAQTDSAILAFNVLEVLKEETDAEHKLAQNQIEKLLFKKKENKCSSKTLSKTIKRLIGALNPPLYSEEEKERFQIVYSGYDQEIEDDSNGYMTNIFYNHLFSFNEIDRLIEGIQFSKILTTEEANRIIEKIKKLTSRHYTNTTSQIYTVPEFLTAPQDQLRENLESIQNAIADQVKIEFVFNGYDQHKALIPVKDENGENKKYLVSPYYILAYNGKYYLLANTDGYDNIAIYRIDLMTEISIPGKDGKKYGIPARKMSETGLSSKLDTVEFMTSHLNMSYDQPVPVQLKIRKDRYTLVHDWFGDQYKISRKRDSSLGDEYDMIRVVCSPYGIINWAMQFSEFVEVIEPQDIREKIRDRLQETLKNYID